MAAMRGRKPKPAAVKRAEGNPGKRRVGREAAAASKGLPSCPAHLSPAAKAEWRRVAGQLPAGLVGQLDRAALAAYCQHYGRWVAAEKQLASEGDLVVSPNGHLVQSPWLAIAAKSAERMLKVAAELGLTPVARTRLAVPDGEDAGGDGSIESFLRLAQ